MFNRYNEICEGIFKAAGPDEIKKRRETFAPGMVHIIINRLYELNHWDSTYYRVRVNGDEDSSLWVDIEKVRNLFPDDVNTDGFEESFWTGYEDAGWMISIDVLERNVVEL